MGDIAEQYAWGRTSGRQIQLDQVVYSRGEAWFFKGVTRPAYGNSSGRVTVSRTCPDAYTTSNGVQECPHMWHRNGIDVQEFFPHVFGLYLGDIEGNEA